ncbi:hypothetical protein BJV78DRAFT_1356658 [Lactifluus subvellereus]|nr:hypothetical protein BJV78DRAFT_1356658 [Lactifluus subvellereus]
MLLLIVVVVPDLARAGNAGPSTNIDALLETLNRMMTTTPTPIIQFQIWAHHCLSTSRVCHWVAVAAPNAEKRGGTDDGSWNLPVQDDLNNTSRSGQTTTVLRMETPHSQTVFKRWAVKGHKYAAV